MSASNGQVKKLAILVFFCAFPLGRAPSKAAGLAPVGAHEAPNTPWNAGEVHRTHAHGAFGSLQANIVFFALWRLMRT